MKFFFRSTVCSAAVAFLLLFTCVYAYDLGCQKVWAGPSKNNNPLDCITNVDHIRTKAGELLPTVLCLVMFALLIFIYPPVFVGRQFFGCCGSHRRRPGQPCLGWSNPWDNAAEEEKDDAYPAVYVRNIKLSGFFVFLLSIICLIIIVVGASYFEQAYNGIFDDIKSLVLDYFYQFKIQLDADLKRPDGSYIPPLSNTTLSPVDDVYNSIEKQRSSIKNNYDAYMALVRIGMNIFGIVPFVLLFLLAFAATCDIRRLAPLTCVYFVFALLFSGIAMVLLFVAVLFLNICGELELNDQQRPGILQWYAVPYCESVAPFDSLRDTINNAQTTNAENACTALLSVCDSSAVWTTGSSAFFRCTLSTGNIPSRCGSFAQVQHEVNNTYVKLLAPVCTNNCSVSSCPTDCTVSSLQSTAANVVQLVSYANQGFVAVSRIIPLLDCNFLLRRVLLPFTQRCPSIRNGFIALGTGSGLAAFAFILGIIVAFKGQKTFFKKHGEAKKGPVA